MALKVFSGKFEGRVADLGVEEVERTVRASADGLQMCAVLQ
jgi:hypothetical protein